ncbi:MAG: hypothetical protein ABW046_23335 [Actinoplanes sp.]
MDIFDVGKLVLIIVTPTLVGATALYGPKWCGLLADRWSRSRPTPPTPFGPPIEQIAADLRRLLRLHGDLSASAHMAMRAHRLWAVEAAIAACSIEAARALDVPHPEPIPPATLSRRELLDVLTALSAAGLVLPAKVGPFTTGGGF